MRISASSPQGFAGTPKLRSGRTEGRRGRVSGSFFQGVCAPWTCRCPSRTLILHAFRRPAALSFPLTRAPSLPSAPPILLPFHPARDDGMRRASFGKKTLRSRSRCSPAQCQYRVGNSAQILSAGWLEDPPYVFPPTAGQLEKGTGSS